MSDASQLPPGFVLDPPKTVPLMPGTDGALPPGFVVDGGPASAAPDQSYHGGILPFSKDAQGNVHFDPNAGLLGSIARAFTLPHDVATGQIDPLSNQGIARANEMTATIFPDAAAAAPALRAVGGIPSAEALKTAAQSGYDAVRNMGVQYAPDAVQQAANAARANLERDGVLDNLAPNTFQVLHGLANPPAGAVAADSAGLEAARRAFGNVGKNFNNPTDQMAASRAQDALDAFVQNPPEGAVMAGPGPAAGQALADARANYAAAKRSDQLHGLEDNADRRAAATNSGLNLDNTIRSRVAGLLGSPKARAGFTSDEIALLEQVVSGTPTRNAVRFVGNLLGGGGGLGAVVSGGIGATAGEHFGGLPGLVVGAGMPALGVGAKVVANALTRRALQAADEAVRSRAPLADEWGDIGAPSSAAQGVNLVARALLLSGHNGQNQ